MSSTPSRWPVGIGRTTAVIFTSLISVLEGLSQLASTNHSASHTGIGVSSIAGDLLWYAIIPQQFPDLEVQSAQTVKCLLIINIVVDSGVPFA